jgi:hypothetical protein
MAGEEVETIGDKPIEDEEVTADFMSAPSFRFPAPAASGKFDLVARVEQRRLRGHQSAAVLGLLHLQYFDSLGWKRLRFEH